MNTFEVEFLTEGTVLLSIRPSLDLRTAKAFRADADAAFAAGGRRFLLDFSATGILDSEGLGAVFHLHRRLAEVQGHIVFVAPSKPVRVIMQVTGINQVFPVVESVSAALPERS